MRVVVTGAAGFVGRALVAALDARGDDVVGIDRALGGLRGIEGDLADPAILARAFEDGCDAVVHLATVPGGAAEGDPEAAWRANVDGSRALAAAAANLGNAPRFVFASSIAVLGDGLPKSGVDDATPLAPMLLYGGHKRLIEEWLALLDRRGALNAVSLRLPAIVARPAGAAGLRSAFMSDVFHVIRSSQVFISPVSEDARFWMLSRERLISNLLHALDAPLDRLPPGRAINLPALHVTMRDLVAAIGGRAAKVEYQPDDQLEAQFGNYPPLATTLAERLGFRHDGDLGGLVEAVARGLNEETMR